MTADLHNTLINRGRTLLLRPRNPVPVSNTGLATNCTLSGYQLQKVSRKSQEYKKRPPRHFAQIPAMQSVAFSCTTQKLIQATSKACLTSRRSALLPLKAEKESRKTHSVSLSDLYPTLQPAGYTPLPFTTTGQRSGAGSRRSPAPHLRHPRHPWLISAPFAFSAAKSQSCASPCLRVSVVKSQP